MKFIFHCENFIIVILKSQGLLNQGHVLFLNDVTFCIITYNNNLSKNHSIHLSWKFRF